MLDHDDLPDDLPHAPAVPTVASAVDPADAAAYEASVENETRAAMREAYKAAHASPLQDQVHHDDSAHRHPTDEEYAAGRARVAANYAKAAKAS